MKILVTGFEPWGDWTRNPSGEIAERLDGEGLGGAALVGVVLPVVHGEDIAIVRQAIARERPDAVVSLGLGGGTALNVERVAVNLQVLQGEPGPVDAPVVPDGPAAYFATLPTRDMVEEIKTAGVPARLSYSAGTFLCNHIMYTVCHHIETEGQKIPSGFIHLPPMPEQVVASGGDASMAIEVTRKGVEAGLRAVIRSCGVST